jgi:hypothetical protein
VRTATQAPRISATCEQLADTLRRELLDRMLLLGEAHLRAYWAERSRAILDFQLAQPQSCLSLRREDLEADAQEQMRLVWSFLGLTPPRAVIRQRSDPAVTEHGARPRFPVDRLPPRLRTVINELHATLGYPPL